MSMTNDAVAHAFAAGRPARSSNGNLHTDGRTLTSYRTPIAHHAVDGMGRPIVVYTTVSYSMTTSSKHYPALRSAIRHLDSIGIAADLPHDRTFLAIATAGMRHYGQRIENALRFACATTHRGHRAARREKYVRLVSAGRTWAAWFGMDAFQLIPDDAADAVIAERRAAEAEQHRAAEAERLERLAKDRAEAEAEADAWVQGDRVMPPRDRYLLSTDRLRLRPADPDQTETTRGAIVPTDHVRRIAPLVLRLVRAGRQWTPDYDVRLGIYRLNGIDDAGNVHVGCHTFNRDEIERFAAILIPDLAIA